MDYEELKVQVETLHLMAHALFSEPEADFVTLSQPKIGLYHGWVDTMDEGWTRYALSNMVSSRPAG